MNTPTPSPELLMIRGLIASLPAEDQAKVHELANSIRSLVPADDGHAVLALGLVAAEQQ